MAASLVWRASVDFLALWSAPERAAIIAGATRLSLPPGVVADYPRNRLDADIVESGVVRAFQVADDGREATIGYLYATEYLGALPAVEPHPIVHIQPLVETVVLRLNPRAVQDLFDTDPEFGRALATHTGTILGRIIRVVTVRTLGSILQRVAFDILERATATQLQSGDVVLKLTHEQLADSVGSVREVVTRVLGDLRQAGIVDTGHANIRVIDAARLSQVVHGLVV